MCGGAIISGYIPPTVPGRPKKLTAEYLWPELKRSSNKKYSKPIVDDDFEADFQGFKDDEEESDIDGDVDVDADLMMADIKPFTFSAGRKSHGNHFLNTPSSSFFFNVFVIIIPDHLFVCVCVLFVS